MDAYQLAIRADSYRQKNNAVLAIRDFDEVIKKLDPHNDDLKLFRSWCYAHRGAAKGLIGDIDFHRFKEEDEPKDEDDYKDAIYDLKKAIDIRESIKTVDYKYNWAHAQIGESYFRYANTVFFFTDEYHNASQSEKYEYFKNCVRKSFEAFSEALPKHPGAVGDPWTHAHFGALIVMVTWYLEVYQLCDNAKETLKEIVTIFNDGPPPNKTFRGPKEIPLEYTPNVTVAKASEKRVPVQWFEILAKKAWIHLEAAQTAPPYPWAELWETLLLSILDVDGNKPELEKRLGRAFRYDMHNYQILRSLAITANELYDPMGDGSENLEDIESDDEFTEIIELSNRILWMNPEDAIGNFAKAVSLKKRGATPHGKDPDSKALDYTLAVLKSDFNAIGDALHYLDPGGFKKFLNKLLPDGEWKKKVLDFEISTIIARAKEFENRKKGEE